MRKISLLRKTIYKLKQSACQWSKDPNKSMIMASLKRFRLDYLAFAKNLSTSKIVIMIVYIDYFLFFMLHFTQLNMVKSFLTNQYKIKNLGSCM